MADHIQRVLKPNFGAAWDEVGDEYEKEETFTLSAIKTLEGKAVSEPSRALNISLPRAKTGGAMWLVLDLSWKGRQDKTLQVVSLQLLHEDLWLM